MAKYTGFIKNDQWKLLEPLLPKALPNRRLAHLSSRELNVVQARHIPLMAKLAQ